MGDADPAIADEEGTGDSHASAVIEPAEVVAPQSLTHLILYLYSNAFNRALKLLNSYPYQHWFYATTNLLLSIPASFLPHRLVNRATAMIVFRILSQLSAVSS